MVIVVRNHSRLLVRARTIFSSIKVIALLTYSSTLASTLYRLEVLCQAHADSTFATNTRYNLHSCLSDRFCWEHCPPASKCLSEHTTPPDEQGSALQAVSRPSVYWTCMGECLAEHLTLITAVHFPFKYTTCCFTLPHFHLLQVSCRITMCVIGRERESHRDPLLTKPLCKPALFFRAKISQRKI